MGRRSEEETTTQCCSHSTNGATASDKQCVWLCVCVWKSPNNCISAVVSAAVSCAGHTCAIVGSGGAWLRGITVGLGFPPQPGGGGRSHQGPGGSPGPAAEGGGAGDKEVHVSASYVPMAFATQANYRQ